VIAVRGVLRPREGRRVDALRAAQLLRERAQEEVGTVAYLVSEDPGSGELVVLEVYTGPRAMLSHLATGDFRDISASTDVVGIEVIGEPPGPELERNLAALGGVTYLPAVGHSSGAQPPAQDRAPSGSGATDRTEEHMSTPTSSPAQTAITVSPTHHHVNLAIPVGGLPAQTEFLVEVAGFRPALEAKVEMGAKLAAMDPPRHIPDEKLLWFCGADGLELHLTEDPEHHPSPHAHVAVTVGEALPEVERRLAARSVATRQLLDAPGLRVVACEDPAGNVWEFRGV
jgi:quinol monooxygenase YgiN